MNPLKIGVIGVGHLGRHHARIVASLEGVTLAGVCDARPEQARAIAEPLNAPVYDDPAALLDAVDAVSIAAPTIHHHPLALAALQRGLPTLVEKPIATTVEEAEDLVELAYKKGVPLQIGHIERFNPALEAFRGQGWTPRFIDAERQGLFTFRSTDIGVVHDLMIHDLDALLSIVDSSVTHVDAVGVNVFGAPEDVASVRITFANGCVANLTASRASFQAQRTMRIWSEEGYAALDFGARSARFTRPSESLRAGRLDLDGLDLTQPAAVKEHLFGKLLHVEQVPTPNPAPEPLALELQDFVQAIRTGTPPRVTGADGLRALRVADQIVASLRAHQWEGLPSMATPTSSAIPQPKLFRHRREGSPGATPAHRDGGHAG